jgi:hypothetical protein
MRRRRHRLYTSRFFLQVRRNAAKIEITATTIVLLSLLVVKIISYLVCFEPFKCLEKGEVCPHKKATALQTNECERTSFTSER